MGFDHALEPFRNLFDVIDTGIRECSVAGGHVITMVPWMHQAKGLFEADVWKHITQQCELLGFHHDFADVPYRGRLIGRAGSYKMFEHRIYMASGHYHDEIKYDWFRYWGACMQHEWGDEGKRRGMWEITFRGPGKRPKFKFVPVKFPRFRTLVDVDVCTWPDEKLDTRVRGNFVRVQRTGPRRIREATERLKEHDPRSIEPFVIAVDSAQVAEELQETSDQDPINFEEVVDDYVEQHLSDESDLRAKRLKKIGKLALRGAS